MAIVIKEIHVCTNVEKDRRPQAETVVEMIEKLRQYVEEELERFRLEETGKKER